METLKAIPHPKYESHPAYGPYFGTPTLKDRWQAIREVTPHLVNAWKEYRRWQENLKRFPRKNETPAPQLRELEEHGAIGLPLTSEEWVAVQGKAQKWIEQLNAKRAQKTKRVFQDNNLRVEDPELRHFLTELFQKKGYLQLASSYMKMPLKINNLYTLIFGVEDTSFWRKTFEGTEISSPRATSYMHIDSRFGTIKFLLYLNEVTEENGPFCYVRGSHRFHRSPGELVIRKAMDLSRLDSISLERRKLFWSLPSYLQKKAAFGYDLMEDSEEAAALLAQEKRFLSKDGNLILFDYNGIHRGGMVAKGERHLLQIQLVPDTGGNV